MLVASQVVQFSFEILYFNIKINDGDNLKPNETYLWME